MSQIKEYSIVQLLVHPKIRESVIPYLKSEFFRVDEAKYFYIAISNKIFDNVIPDAATFSIELHKIPNVTELSVIDCLNILKGATREYSSEDEINIRIKIIEDFIRECKLTRVIYNVVNSKDSSKIGDPQHYNQLVDAAQFSISREEFLDLSNPEVLARSQEESLPPGGVIMRSKYSVINKNLTYKGFKYGDVILVGAETGVGKTTYMINEGAYFVDQGFKVAHVFLGDMEVFDAGVQYIACWSRDELVENIASEYEKFYTPDIRSRFKNLKIQAYPSDSITIYELISKLKVLRRQFKFDMLIIDYDANLQESTDSMYKEGGTTYSQLKGFGKSSHATMIASQIKPAYWGTEYLPKEAPNESSKKQMHVDMMFLIGRNPECRLIGTSHIAKVRRGQDSKTFRLQFKYHYGKIEEISQEKYDQILATWKARDTKGDLIIDGMSG